MSKSKTNNNIVGLAAFAALIVKAVSLILGALGFGGSILTLIADVICSAIILAVAWTYARTCKKAWRIVYFVILALVVLGYVLGYTLV